MSDQAFAQMLAQLRPLISAEELTAVEKMLIYFGRASLWPSKCIEASAEEPLTLLMASETERYRITVPEMVALFDGLRQGQAVDWEQLRKER